MYLMNREDFPLDKRNASFFYSAQLLLGWLWIFTFFGTYRRNGIKVFGVHLKFLQL